MSRKSKRAWGLVPKNDEQSQAILALLNPEIDLVVLEGSAGSGKTLLALAAGLEQVVENRMYKEIIFTRAPIGIGEDMGFLPGTEEEKLAPWCGALMDNLEYLIGDDKSTESILRTKIKIRAMQFMRGRSFMNKYLIIDEVQNITVQQLKVLLTRVGEDTKIVCLGDIGQIDNKRLTIDNNALSILCDKAAWSDFIKVVELPHGVRSRVCSWASENL